MVQDPPTLYRARNAPHTHSTIPAAPKGAIAGAAPKNAPFVAAQPITGRDDGPRLI
jgi:hypothetical protein